jgi:hypothetical protein
MSVRRGRGARISDRREAMQWFAAAWLPGRFTSEGKGLTVEAACHAHCQKEQDEIA